MGNLFWVVEGLMWSFASFVMLSGYETLAYFVENTGFGMKEILITEL